MAQEDFKKGKSPRLSAKERKNNTRTWLDDIGTEFKLPAVQRQSGEIEEFRKPSAENTASIYKVPVGVRRTKSFETPTESVVGTLGLSPRRVQMKKREGKDAPSTEGSARSSQRYIKHTKAVTGEIIKVLKSTTMTDDQKLKQIELDINKAEKDLMDMEITDSEAGTGTGSYSKSSDSKSKDGSSNDSNSNEGTDGSSSDTSSSSVGGKKKKRRRRRTKKKRRRKKKTRYRR